MTNVYEIMISGINFLSKHIQKTGVNATIVPGAVRNVFSVAMTGYPPTERDMMAWVIVNSINSRRRRTDIVATLDSRDTGLDTGSYYVNVIRGLMHIKEAGDWQFRVRGDDYVMLTINGVNIYRNSNNEKIVKFASTGMYPFELVHQESTGGQMYIADVKRPGESDYSHIDSDEIFRYDGPMLPGLMVYRGNTGSAWYNAGQKYEENFHDIYNHIKNYPSDRLSVNYMWLDNRAYRFWDRGNWWGYAAEGYLFFPESGEWEIGIQADNFISVEINDIRYKNAGGPWDYDPDPIALTIRATSGMPYKIKILCLEEWGGEFFLFAIRKKGDTQWIRNLTGIAYHDEFTYNGVKI
jgi:hypothetical protein